MTTAYLIPREGLTVLQPRSAKSPVPVPLPAEGAKVELTTYWHRRLADGDVTEGRAPGGKSAKPTTQTGE